VSPVYALAENVRHGAFVPGDADDDLTKARFAAEIVRWALQPELQDRARGPMMREARERFDWEKFVDQWEAWALGTAFRHCFPVQLQTTQIVPPLALPAGSNAVTDALRAGSEWEPEVSAHFHRAVGGVAIDVGAYAGEHTLLLAQHASAVWAFEPQPAMVALLRKNTAHLPTVTVHDVAAYDRETTLDIVDDCDWRSGTSPGACYAPAETGIPTVTLDSIWCQHGRPKVSLVKIDAEGCDAAVLCGASTLIATCRPVILFEDMNPAQAARHTVMASCADLLTGLGYRISTIGDTHNRIAEPAVRVSVLTASIREDRLGFTKKALDAQTFRGFEWLVCSPEPCHLADRWLPDVSAGRYCSLMAAWNSLTAAATGDLLIFLSDLTHLEPNALQQWVDHFTARPTTGVSAWHVQYPTEAMDQMIWLDYRLHDLNKQIPPTKMEFRAAAIPASMVRDIGGFDVAYDDHPAMGEKDACQRAVRHGYTFYLDGAISAKFVEHAPYDKKFQEGLLYFAQKHDLMRVAT
jgi:FkbM family methyltransferase